MALFSSSFLAVVGRQNECELNYKKTNLTGKISNEKDMRIYKDTQDDLAEKIAKFTNLNDKNLLISTLLADDAVFLNSEFERKNNLTYQDIAQNFTVGCQTQDIIELEKKLNLHFNSVFTLLKVLYHLSKEHGIAGVCAHIMKFDNHIAILICDENNVYYANSTNMENIFDSNLSDNDEIFYEILRNEINIFYNSENSDFINNIFIYNDDSLSQSISYIIYTRILVKTTLLSVNLADFINKLAIKERKKKH